MDHSFERRQVVGFGIIDNSASASFKGTWWMAVAFLMFLAMQCMRRGVLGLMFTEGPWTTP